MEITFTTSQVLALCSAIVLVSGAVTVILNGLTKISAPNKLQNVRLDNIELRLDRHDELLKRDLLRFEDLETGNKYTQIAILAILEHSIDGNNIAELKDAKSQLQKYLIER